MTRRFPDMRMARDRWTDGEAIAAGVLFLVGIITLLGTIALFAPYARAHDTGKGWSYPWECCHDQDCAEISADRVKSVSGGYIVDGRFTVAQKEVKDSPDGRYHACFPKPDFLRCLFVPPPSG